jgi:hypothetical protein
VASYESGLTQPPDGALLLSCRRWAETRFHERGPGAWFVLGSARYLVERGHARGCAGIRRRVREFEKLLSEE